MLGRDLFSCISSSEGTLNLHTRDVSYLLYPFLSPFLRELPRAEEEPIPPHLLTGKESTSHPAREQLCRALQAGGQLAPPAKT